MRRLLASIDFRDVVGASGFGVLVYGVYRINLDAALIVAGILMLGVAIAAARK